MNRQKARARKKGVVGNLTFSGIRYGREGENCARGVEPVLGEGDLGSDSFFRILEMEGVQIIFFAQKGTSRLDLFVPCFSQPFPHADKVRLRRPFSRSSKGNMLWKDGEVVHAEPAYGKPHVNGLEQKPQKEGNRQEIPEGSGRHSPPELHRRETETEGEQKPTGPARKYAKCGMIKLGTQPLTAHAKYSAS